MSSVLIWLAGAQAPIPTAAIRTSPSIGPQAPGAEKFTFGAEWRFIRAGAAVLEVRTAQALLNLQSAGIVASLYKVDDSYSATYEDSFCAVSTLMDAREGNRHRETRVAYDRNASRASYLERDMIQNSTVRESSVEIPPCTGDVLGALMKVRKMSVEVGKSVQVPMSDGRRAGLVTVTAQERENVKTPAGSFPSIRYEAGIMNGVIYPRKGKVEVWLSDDARKIPVQIRIRLNFPIGSVTLQLEKLEQT